MHVNPQKMLDTGVVVPCEYTKVQQNGIDLSLKEELKLMPGESRNVLLNETIKLPANLCAELKIRSTFSRMGIFLSSGFWDSGFQGSLGCTLYNFSGREITIPINERVCQVIISEAESASEYNGQYQGT